ncbi:lipopolysaccharide biosynthesis protein [Limnoglobus roseus]|uniref:Polysaccharide biosynthesis protein n=1 Tax=Limnoglobus roseus TaxID=2598579 RepID=A0A5C1A6X7_9BACT|nr:polysaccharide biosynthesis C-terminal domain-containing protein [Limnoglobus roseus]QEL14941.1 polysaccharide biosynthesis protein [Limnoglobus roseus]
MASRFTFLVSAGSNWLAFAATLAVSFFLTPYLIDTLGKPRYDVWCVVEAVLAYFTLLDMGLAACLVRYVAKHHAVGEREPLNRMASACLALYAGAGLIAFAVGAPLAAVLTPSLDAKLGGDGDVLAFMLLMLANLAVTLPLSVFPSVLDGLDRYAAKSAVRIGFLAVRTAGIVWAVNHTSSLLPLAVFYTLANLGEHAAFAVLSFRFLPGLRFRWSLVDRDTLRHVRGYSVDAFLAMLAGRVTVQTGAILVGLFLPAGQVTFFATAGRLIEYAKTLLRTITATLTPGVSAMEARGDWPGIARLMLTATRWVLYIVLPVNVGLWLFGKPFLARWVGPEFVTGSFPAVAILAATLSLGVAQSVASRILYGLGRLRLFARLALAEAGLNLALMLSLIRFGVEGVAVAVAVPNVLFCIAVLVYTGRVIGLNLRAYLAAWLKPLAAVSVPSAMWLLMGEVPPSWPGIFGGIAVGLVPYAVLVAAMELAKRKRKPADDRPPIVAVHATTPIPVFQPRSGGSR